MQEFVERMRLINDLYNKKTTSHLYLDDSNIFEARYKELRKNRIANEKARREKEEFRSRQPLRFP